MSAGTVLAIAIPVLVVLAGIVLFTTARRSDANRAMGSLSRETRRRDRGATPTAATTQPVVTGREVELAAGQARRSGVGTLERVGDTALAPYVPPDADQVGFTRRQFLNRGNTILMVLGISGFGAAVVAFLWPPKQEGTFGSTIGVGNVDEVRQNISDNAGFYYLASGRTWITEFPASAVGKAETAGYGAAVVEGMRSGFVALYQKCPHLGCRVPECATSQWFECPCHGSQYNRVGEKKAGPAPRGMDHFALRVVGGTVSVDTSTVIPGAAIGTNTTGQEAEGPHCISGGGDH